MITFVNSKSFVNSNIKVKVIQFINNIKKITKLNIFYNSH